MNKPNKTVLFDINRILNKIAIEEGQTVAELGCGNFGYFVFPVARLIGSKGKLYAVDILKATLEDIKKRAMLENFQQIETVWSNLEIFKGTKIESASLDQALLVNILHQSNKKVEMLRESIRMLKNGGRLLVVEWKNIASPIGPESSKRVNKNNLKEASLKLGLILESEFEVGPYHYGLIFHKS
ncbi:methyltransferase domain-containing protein [Patescibacteria group bacterium]|nr:methyltransferase domain-containing protein [Patescibacteria group bacterium]